jgi:thiamine transport system ATP-binding protein
VDFERSVTDAVAEAAAADRAPPAVELDGVTKRYGDTAAVDDVSLRVREGEFFTLVGPSGCGKTTTLRLIAGFEEPTAGTVRFFGESVAGVPPEDRDVGVVFQNYALFPHMTVGENVGYGLNFADPPEGVTREERVAELLALVDLPDAADRDPESLSGGQQQRVAMARALAPGPDVLLLDEPMSALDAQLRERLRVQVRTIQSELSITTVYVTHDQEEALAISDRVAVMRDGAPEQIAPPRTVYREPATRFVAEFVGDNNVFAGRITDVEGADAADEGASDASDGSAASAGATRTAAVDVGGETLSVRIDGAADVAVGDRLTFCVRPEYLRIDEGESRLAATVASAEFLGETTRVTLDWGGRDLVVRTRDPLSDEVVVGFDPEDAHVIDDRTRVTDDDL